MNDQLSLQLETRLESEKKIQDSMSSEQTSVSFPYTRYNAFSGTKLSTLGTRHIRFQPIRTNMMRELLTSADTPPKSDNNSSRSRNETEISKCSKYTESINVSEDEDIDNEKNELFPRVIVPSVKSIATTKRIDIMPMSSIFTKLCIDDDDDDDNHEDNKNTVGQNEKPAQELYNNPMKASTTKVPNRCTTTLSSTNNTLKYNTPSQNRLTNPRQNIQCSIRSVIKDNIKTTIPNTPSVKMEQPECTPRREQNMVNKYQTPIHNQMLTNKNYITPRQNVPGASLGKVEYSKASYENNMKTPNNNNELKKNRNIITPSQNMRSASVVKLGNPKQYVGPNVKRSEMALRERNMNVVTENQRNTGDIDNEKSSKRNVQFSMPIPSANLPNKSCKSFTVRGKEYIIICKLGEGGSSQVYKCLEPETFEHRAIKIVNLCVDPITAEGYINEVKMLSTLQGSDHVIKMYDYEYTKQTLCVVMEKGNMDLSVFLRNTASKSTQLPAYLINYYWMEMLNCVKEIHDNGIIHSDLKPSNFMIVNGSLKLIDFGIASRLSADMTSIIKNVQVGTFNYISPEAIQDSRSDNSVADDKPRIRISYKSDVWSLGCILYQMVYRKTPFQSYGFIMAKVAAIMDENHKIPYPPADQVSVQIINIIKKCLTYEMSKRPTVRELIDLDICRHI